MTSEFRLQRMAECGYVLTEYHFLDLNQQSRSKQNALAKSMIEYTMDAGVERRNSMDRDKHIEIHKELHAKLDELVADYITHNEKGLIKTSVMELIQWSHLQTINPNRGRK